MKGDFSRILEGDYECFLFEQGKPLTDSQLNWRAMKNISDNLKKANVKFPAEYIVANVVAEQELSIPSTNLVDWGRNPGNESAVDLGAFMTEDETRLGYPCVKGDQLKLFCQPRYNTARISTEPFNGLHGLGAVLTPHFFVSTVLAPWTQRGKSSPRPRLASAVVANKNELLRVEIHSTKSGNRIDKIKWARANASTALTLSSIENEKLTFTKECSFLKNSQYLEFEFEHGGTIGCQLLKIAAVGGDKTVVVDDMPNTVANLCESLLKGKVSNAQFRVWDGVVSDTSEFEADSLKMKISDHESFSFVPGDYWLVVLRNGGFVESLLRNDGVVPIDTGWKIEIKGEGANATISQESAPPDEGSVDPSRWSPLKHKPEAQASLITQVAPYALAAPANSLDVELKSLAVSRWLASMKLEEIASLSKSQMCERIKSACSESDYETESLNADIDAILERRSLLLGSTSLALS